MSSSVKRIVHHDPHRGSLPVQRFDGAAVSMPPDNYAQLASYRKIAILAEGFSNPLGAKTATCLLRYRPEDVIAVLDSSQAGKTTDEVFHVGGATPILSSLSSLESADSLFLGISPPGGILPPSWRSTILQAIDLGMDVVSGLHEFLSEDEEFAQAARAKGCRLIDVRKNNERTIAAAESFSPSCLRIHTVGQDCSVGKMTAALEIEEGLRSSGFDARFLATGQTGIMVRGAGVPVDCVVADFISGAVEQLVHANQEHEILLIEGQGSITHPSFSGVTLGLLHGCAPQGLVLCYEVGRERLKSLPDIPTTPLATLRQLYETAASIRYPSRVIGVAMNTMRVSQERADREKQLVEAELGLPTCDVCRHGPDVLVEAIVQFKQLQNQQTASAAALPDPPEEIPRANHRVREMATMKSGLQ